MNNKSLKTVLSLLLTVILLATQITVFTAFAEAKTVYVGFSSDVHNLASDNVSADRFSTWADGVRASLGNITFDTFGLCGDNASSRQTQDQFWESVAELDKRANKSYIKNLVYTTGNHDAIDPGHFDETVEYDQSDIRSKITRIGEPDIKTDGSYQVYCFGAKGDSKYLNADVMKLESYLAECDTTKPVFILAHYPLHDYGSRKVSNASAVIDVLNNYPNAVFLWGHNHTEGDTHYGKVYSGSIDGNTKINFIYASAGCMSDSEYSEGSRSVTAKGAVVALDGDETFTFTYYDINQKPLNSYVINIKEGTASVISGTEYADNEDTENKYLIANALTDGETYVISAEGFGMTQTVHDGYTNATGYSYYGFYGKQLAIEKNVIAKGMQNAMLWTCEKVDGGYAFKNSEGKYLSSSYTSSKGGGIFLGDEPEAWTYSGSMLTSKVSGKNLAFDNDGDVNQGFDDDDGGEAMLFTIRSTGDMVTFYKRSDPDEELPTAKLGDYIRTERLTAGQYIVVANEKALTSVANDGYKSGNNTISGLNGITVNSAFGFISADYVKENGITVWTVKKSDSSFTFMSDDKYLASQYSSSWRTKTSKLFLGDTAETWSLSGGKLQGQSSGYLAWDTGTEEGLFTVNASGSANVVSLYKLYSEDQDDKSPFGDGYEKASRFVDGQWVIVTVDGRMLSSIDKDGYTTRNGSYTGFEGVIANDDNVTVDTMWYVEKTDEGYSLKTKDGLYLAASGSSNGNNGSLYITDTPSYWMFSGNTLHTVSDDDTIVYLSYDAKSEISGVRSGEADLFTVHTTDEEARLYTVKNAPDLTGFMVYYDTNGKGSVKRVKELILTVDTRFAVRGSDIASADAGYRFDRWIDGDGNTVATTEKFVPDVTGMDADRTYTAVFVECDPVKITYTAQAHGKVNVEFEMVAPVTGKPKGSCAIPNEGYHFEKWIDAKGNTVSDEDLFIPTKGDSILFTETTYTAVFAKDPDCIIDYVTALTEDGDYALVFNGVDVGRYDLYSFADGWAIKDKVSGLYISSDGTDLTYTEYVFTWRYDGGFYTKYRKFGNSVKVGVVYLTAKNGELAVTSTVTDVTVVKHEEYLYHDCDEYTIFTKDGHGAICTRCDKEFCYEHEYKDGYDCDCDVCGYVRYMLGDLDGDGAITESDAIYMLMYTFYPEDYPIEQPHDFDSSGSIDEGDALHLLMHTFFEDDYPLYPKRKK